MSDSDSTFQHNRVGEVVSVVLAFCLTCLFVCLQEFRRLALSGYVLNSEQDSFYYVSLSRLHPQRIHIVKKLSESIAANRTPPQEESVLESEVDAEDAVRESKMSQPLKTL